MARDECVRALTGKESEAELILEKMRVRYDRAFKRAHAIACSPYLEDFFDGVGLRRSL